MSRKKKDLEDEIDFIDEDLDEDDDLDEDAEEESDPDPIKDQEKEIKREREQEELAADTDNNDVPAGELLPPDDDIEVVDEKKGGNAELFVVDGVIQVCVGCGDRLTVRNVDFDRNRCKRNGWKDPVTFVCEQEECQEYRRAEQDDKSTNEEEGDAVDDVAAVYTYTRVEDGHVVAERPRVEGDGLVSVLADIDDETPRLVKVRLQAGIPLDFFRSESRAPRGCYPVSPRPALPPSSPSESPVIPVHERPLPSSQVVNSEEVFRRIDRRRKIEDDVYGREHEPEPIPPPKDETEAIERQVAEIVEAEKKRIEEAARKIVRKRRVRYKDKETPHLRLLCGITTRALAAVLDTFEFNKPFQVLDRSLLYNMRTKYGRWYNALQVYARTNGCDIRDATRRAQYKYLEDCADDGADDYADELGGSDRGPKDEVVTIGPEREPLDVEVVMVGGAAISMTHAEAEALLKPPKTKVEILPDGSTRIHVVKEFKAPAKIALRASRRVRKLISPGTYGELMNMLPYRMEQMMTREEEAFYKDYANGNLSRDELKKKHWDFNEEDILLIENRIVNHAFRMKLVALLPENSSRSAEQQMAENWAREAKLISKTSGGAINGSIQAGKLDRYGRRCALNSFWTAPLAETYGGWQPSEGGRGPDRDDYSEDSAA